MLDGASVELDHPEVGALRGDHAYQIEDEILWPHVRPELAVRDDLDGGRDFHVDHPAEGPHARHVGRPHADSHGSHRAVAARVAVGADDHHPRQHVAALGQDLVADPALVAPHVMELRDPLLGHKFSDLLLVGGRLGRLRGHAVVEDDRDLGRVPHDRLEAGPFEDLEELVHDQGRVLVRHGEVDGRLHDHPRRHLRYPARSGQYLLGNGHSHGLVSFRACTGHSGRPGPPGAGRRGLNRRSSWRLRTWSPSAGAVGTRLPCTCSPSARRSRCIPRRNWPTASARAGCRWARP